MVVRGRIAGQDKDTKMAGTVSLETKTSSPNNPKNRRKNNDYICS